MGFVANTRRTPNSTPCHCSLYIFYYWSTRVLYWSTVKLYREYEPRVPTPFWRTRYMYRTMVMSDHHEPSPKILHSLIIFECRLNVARSFVSGEEEQVHRLHGHYCIEMVMPSRCCILQLLWNRLSTNKIRFNYCTMAVLR